jgi:type II secretion system protein H
MAATMTSPTGNNRSSDSRRRAFTLIELIVVMALMTVAIALVAPSLAKFFHSRNLTSEADRLLALTRYGQSRAVTEGMPMVLWIDAKKGRYGLQADSTYLENDPRKEQFDVAKKLQLDVQMPLPVPAGTQWWQLMTTPTSLQSILWGQGQGQGQGQGNAQANLPTIRFTPDGQISASSPERVGVRDTQDKKSRELWITRSASGMNYEIQTGPSQIASR